MAQAGYSIGELATLAGVTERALRHYEAKGLLRPAREGNGYRRYDQGDVARLQQVLIYRACGLGLDDIAAILDDPAHDEAALLRAHLSALREEQARLERLVANVVRTIAELEGAGPMGDKERFDGLKRAAVEENERKHGAEARGRWGDKAVDSANANVLGMDEGRWNRWKELEDEVIALLGEAMADGDTAGEAAARLCAAHKEWLLMTWSPEMYSLEAHRGLGAMYTADERFTSYYDERAGEGAAAFLSAALQALEG